MVESYGNEWTATEFIAERQARDERLTFRIFGRVDGRSDERFTALASPQPFVASGADGCLAILSAPLRSRARLSILLVTESNNVLATHASERGERESAFSLSTLATREGLDRNSHQRRGIRQNSRRYSGTLPRITSA